jgi:hypothetical protein
MDQHSFSKLDPDPNKVNADPKHWFKGRYPYWYINMLFYFFQIHSFEWNMNNALHHILYSEFLLRILAPVRMQLTGSFFPFFLPLLNFIMVKLHYGHLADIGWMILDILIPVRYR